MRVPGAQGLLHLHAGWRFWPTSSHKITYLIKHCHAQQDSGALRKVEEELLTVSKKRSLMNLKDGEDFALYCLGVF